ncbi:MAG TPA: FHA domain-containing protein [Myxococcota bacterium]|nr:FHA domain-containing protein [Myxococcota bacterium]
MSSSQVFVQLTPEFGGDTFGPVVGQEYRIGTSDENHVRIAEGLGVDPHHVRLVRKSGETFFLTPVERSSAVYLYRAGQRQPVLVQGPTVVVPGDSFSLASPQGVRFVLVAKEVDRRKRQRPAAGGDEGTQAQQVVDRMKRGLVSEVFRRIRASVLTTYVGRMAQNTWFFIKTRQFLSPVYIVSFFMMMSGWGFSAKTCLDGNKARAAQQSAEEKHKTCEDLRAASASVAAGGADATTGELVANILSDAQWPDSLAWDDMHQIMIQEIKDVLTRATDTQKRKVLDGWYLGKGRGADAPPYVVAQTALTSAGVDAKIASMLAWTVVDSMSVGEARQHGVDGRFELWGVVPSSDVSYRQCTRGPFRLTWRQAQALSLKSPLDVLFGPEEMGRLVSGIDSSQAVQDIVAKYQAARINAGLDTLEVNAYPPITGETMLQIPLTSAACLVTQRDAPGAAFSTEDRLTSARVASAFAKRLGAEASRLPAKNQPNWLSGRIAMLYALDLKAQRADGVQITSMALGAAFAPLKDADPAGYEMVAKRTGQTLGRAVAIPCVLLMTGKRDDIPDEMGPPPKFDACAILMARAQFGTL